MSSLRPAHSSAARRVLALLALLVVLPAFGQTPPPQKTPAGQPIPPVPAPFLLLSGSQPITVPLPAATILYNGIRLAPPWPPIGEFQFNEPMPVPYLSNPPAVIPIDVGRQLFVDDFLIESTTLKRVWHKPVMHTNNPVLRPDKPWEMEGGPMAMPFSDGVWFDPQEQKFKMWYMGGYGKSTCYAWSSNGVDWVKPELDVVPGSNIVLKEPRDSSIVWLDQEETNSWRAKTPGPNDFFPDAKSAMEQVNSPRRYKMFRSVPEKGKFGLTLHTSADGIHWGAPVLRTGPAGDRTTVFRNPFRGVWVYSLRGGVNNARVRRYWEVKDLFNGAPWEKADDAPLWVGADRFDPPRPDLGDAAQLYNLDAVAYEGLFVGLFTIWRGDKNIPPGRPKPNSIWLGFSRDGYHWQRPNREPFIDVSEKQGDWNWGNVQSVGGGFLVQARQLLFYFSGRSGQPGKRDGGGATGLAYLRRDGFCSMEAGPEGGVLMTKPVKFNSGRVLCLNADAHDGEIRVEILDEKNQPVKTTVPIVFTSQAGAKGTNMVEFTLDKNSVTPLTGPQSDMTLQQAQWANGAILPNLDTVRGRAVKFRFHLRNAKLYSFWVSPMSGFRNGGASGGFVAAGGPHFDSLVDRIGSGSYRAWPPPPPATNTVPPAPVPPKPEPPKKN